MRQSLRRFVLSLALLAAVCVPAIVSAQIHTVPADRFEAKVSPWADVTAYGARCDDATDDSAAFQAAINATAAGDLLNTRRGAAIYVPAGGCRIYSKITLRTGVRIFGDSHEASRILSFVSNDDLFYYDADATAANVTKTVQIDNLTILGRVASTGAYIHLTGTADPSLSPSLKNVYVYGNDMGAIGIWVKGSLQAHFDLVKVQGCTSDGWRLEAPNNLPVFTATYAQSNGGHGYNIEATELTMNSPGADGNGGDGYHLQVTGLTMNSPEAEANHGAIIHLASAHYVTINSGVLAGSAASTDGLVFDASDTISVNNTVVQTSDGTPSGYSIKLINAPTDITFWQGYAAAFGSGTWYNPGNVPFTWLKAQGSLDVAYGLNTPDLGVSKASAGVNTTVRLTNSYDSTDAYHGSAIEFSGSAGAQALISASENPLHWGGGVLRLQTYTNAGALNTGITMLRTGEVGIGTVTPGEPLEVAKTGAGVNSLLRLTNNYNSSDDYHGSAIQFMGQSGNPQALISASENPLHWGGGVLRLQTYTNAGALNTGIAVLRTGEVGIGTAVPSAELEVYSPSMANIVTNYGGTSKFKVETGNGYTTIGTTTSTPLVLAANDVEWMRIIPGGEITFTGSAGSDTYASQTTGWRVTNAGAADFRYLYTDELHAKSFIADLEQALAGGQIISKSVAVVSSFTCPAAGATATLAVEDLPGAADMQVFQANDWVALRSFSRSGGGLAIADCVGQVSAPDTSPAGTQNWTFTRGSGGNAGTMSGATVVLAKSLALDYGVSGNGYYEVNSIDGTYGANSPYMQIATWATSPVAANRTVRLRTGQLIGVTGTSEYGILAGAYAATNGSYFRASDSHFDLSGITAKWWDGTTNVITISPNSGSPYIAIGNPAPLTYGGTGVFAGIDSSTAKFSVGDGTTYVRWDGSTLAVKGSITVTGGNALTSATGVAAGGAAADVNANVTTIDGGKITTNSITAGKMVLLGRDVLNTDPMLEDLTAWITGVRPIVFASVTDAPVGTTVMRSSAIGYSEVEDARYTPISSATTYRVSFWARGVGADGTLYAALRQYTDNAGTPCAGNLGRYPYKPSGATPTSGWTEYSFTWGPADWQTGVKFVRLYFLLNLSSSTGYIEVVNPRLQEMNGSALIVNGTITADALTSDFVIANTIRSSGATALATGAGFWLDAASTPTFRVGDPSGGNLKWDGSNLTAGGWTFGASALTKTAGGNTVGVDAAGAYSFYAGPTGAPTFTVTPAGMMTATGATLTNGQIVFDNGTFMKVAGMGFGSTSQFIEWWGPHLASLSSCTEANAVYYLKTDGSAYFGGALLAGLLRNSVSATVLNDTNVATLGGFSSKGGSITTTWGYDFYANTTYIPSNIAGWTAADRTAPTATFLLERSTNGGTSYSTVWNNTVCTGTVDAEAPNGVDPGHITKQVNCGGTYADPDHNTNARAYRLSFVSDAHVFLPGGVTRNTLALGSVEQ